jgi:hypothetical protein
LTSNRVACFSVFVSLSCSTSFSSLSAAPHLLCLVSVFVRLCTFGHGRVLAFLPLPLVFVFVFIRLVYASLPVTLAILHPLVVPFLLVVFAFLVLPIVFERRSAQRWITSIYAAMGSNQAGQRVLQECWRSAQR